MNTRTYGRSEITVPVLGFGAGLIGEPSMDEQYAGYFLNQIVDHGITLIDTARGYGLSEERIGRHLSWRRHHIVLSTKVGYSIPGYADWTYDCIIAGVHHALRMMKTDYLDIVHLHSCPKDILERGEVVEALLAVRRDGYVRCCAYSGENDALDYAAHSQHFSGLMSSVNIFDQRSIGSVLPAAATSGMGYIAKRPIGNAPWQFNHRPAGKYCEEYWDRMRMMNLDFGDEWLDVALRFSAFTSGVSSVVVGTTNLDHIKNNVEIVSKGPLPEHTVQSIRTAFSHYESQWIGQV